MHNRKDGFHQCKSLYEGILLLEMYVTVLNVYDFDFGQW